MRILRSQPLALFGVTLAIGLTCSLSTALAANTFLLQFGEHKTETEARNQWENLRAANPEILGNLKFYMSEVKKDGTTLFRSQASGVANRANAQAACADLVTKKADCLVVETSMYEPVVATPKLVEPVKTSAPLPADVMEPEVEMVAPSALDAELEPAPQLVDIKNAANPTPITKKSSFKEALLPWLSNDNDKAEVEAATEVVTQAAVEEAEASAEDALPAGSISEGQPETLAKLPNAPSEEKGMLDSIGDSIKSFMGDDEPEIKVTDAELASRAPKPLAAPVEQVATADVTRMGAQKMPDPAMYEPVEPMVVESAPVSVPVEPQIVSVTDGDGEVEVAEAIRVPLSSSFGANAVPVPVSKPVGYGGFPSQPQSRNSLWVQISKFTGKEAAMAYWRELAYSHNELVRMLRVRIITPWQASRRGTTGSTTLRVGPLASQEDVGSLCNVASEKNLNCTLVSEVGNSAPATTVRHRETKADRYNQRASSPRTYGQRSASGMHWVQLGAFAGVVEAQARWRQLSSVHNDLLGRLQPQISYPALTSSSQPIYHLRTGPFVARQAAQSLCDSMKTRHMTCVVVQSR